MAEPDPERPCWADERLSFCGFTRPDAPGPAAVECATQVHGRTVHVAGDAPPADGDGLWTNRPGQLVAIRVADCTPLLLWDPEAGAVAAVHAGWRGTAQDIAGEAMRVGQRLGVDPERTRAAIGPCISGAAYEVGDEVVDGLRGAGLADCDFGLTMGPRGRPHVDLRLANRALLRRAGVPDASIEDVGGCSWTDPRYESYRRDGAASKRMRAIIGLALPALLALLIGCRPSPPPDVPDETLPTAEQTLRRAIADHPDDAWLRAQLARSLAAQGRHREATVQGRLALGADPQLWQAAYNLACHHAALGEADVAIRWLQAALAAGQVTQEEVLADPDLAPLHDDQRFAIYRNTGLLPSEEADALVQVQPARVAVGESATVTVSWIALNRPLMGDRSPPELSLLSPPLPLRPQARRETFSTGSEGGREFRQRTWHFGFSPTAPGPLAIGPFRVRGDDGEQLSGAVVLDVVPGEGPLTLGDPQFFGAPSSGDEPTLQALRAQSALVELAQADFEGPPLQWPWIRHGDAEVRGVRFRASSLDALPAAIPARPDGALRSVLVQRGPEGWSHVIDRRPAPDGSPAP